MQNYVSAMEITMHRSCVMDNAYIICNIPQTSEFHPPCQLVNILIQIRQKVTIVSILHNNHALFCFWVLCDSINFKEIIKCALGMVSELSNKNNNVEILKVLCSYILSASFRSAIIASVNIEVEQELQQRRQRAHAAMLKLEKKHLVRITLFYVWNSANIYKLFRNWW